MRWRLLRAFNPTLFFIPIILTAVGIVVIYSITYTGVTNLLLQQLTFSLIGIFLLLFFTFFDYRNLRALGPILFVAGLLLLGLVALPRFFPGLSDSSFFITSFGATRWINLGLFQLQPSEVEKLVLLIAAAALLSQEKQRSMHELVLIFLIMVIPIALVLTQPDLGTAVILAIGAGAIVLAAGFSRILMAGCGFLLVALSPLVWSVLRDYQKERLVTFLNPGSDPLGAGYNVLQSQIAIGSGGIFGRGLGFGSQSQLNFLPVAHTDFIFAGFAEATGFIGSFILIGVIALLLSQVLAVAKVAHDRFGMLLALGIGVTLFAQFFINIGMNLGLVPVTGIPLPFLSYGGTSLLVNMIALGILQSIYIRRKKITF